ncbi:UDP-N-acetylmuramoyl-L-alanine--D-glutamate ligase [Bacteriovorax sp. BAL6_X]|uniref:UDP-N-acetylmuramoyl-L-alanine--D-glutamate ligase n=1 Tax=Bacteriovorax sp. BAL6_X TaxID=1201290 RepID=UPI0003863EF3|nr:UDP-N-acetylmuramoyl-L-alanine--D-glutamate ligase [Bacteriovorax sp. BAL6_X]EPZ50702.1 UDP-N-acetylmuramoyl-L-alanine--D-glutamate ligase [Bacteriovorax sp. BAL6_X]
MIINESLNKYNKIAVVGLGLSGLSALRLLTFLGKDIYLVNQGAVETWPAIEDSSCIKARVVQDEACNILGEMDLIILSPGMSKELPLFSKATCPIWCEIELAYKFADAPILGVTGTNGKTTVVSFLEECGKQDPTGDYFVGGNIGTPFCDYIYERMSGEREPAQGIILELSSFQLNLIDEFQCDVAGLLNLTFSHGERYDDLKTYGQDKFEIFKNMANQGIAFLPNDLEVKNEYAIRNEHQLDLSIGKVKEELSEVIDIMKLKIYGEHNLVNTYFVYLMWDAFTGNIKAFQKACDVFNGVEYRLQMIKQDKGQYFFNDAKSTNWEATLTALNGVKELGNVELIIGGQLRGHGDNQLEKLLPFKDQIKRILFFGESGKVLSELNFEIESEYFENLDDIFKAGFNADVILFSPAFPSFDQYANYVKRGEHFTKLALT